MGSLDYQNLKFLFERHKKTSQRQENICKIFSHSVQNRIKDLYPEYVKNICCAKEDKQLSENMSKRTGMDFSPEDIGVANKHRRRCSTSVFIRENSDSNHTEILLHMGTA